MGYKLPSRELIKRKRRGFTLVEVLACVLILTLAATGVMSAFSHFAKVTEDIGNMLKAAFALEWKLNDLRIQNVSVPFPVTLPPALTAVVNENFPELLTGQLSWQFRDLDIVRFPGGGKEVFIRIAWMNGQGDEESQSVFSIL